MSKPVWVSMDRDEFDSSEFGSLGKEIRLDCRFFIQPLTTEVVEKACLAVSNGGTISIDEVDDDGEGDLLYQVLCGLVCDWYGIMDEEDVPIPYSVENVRKIARRYPGVAGAWVDIAMNLSLVEVEVEKEEEGVVDDG